MGEDGSNEDLLRRWQSGDVSAGDRLLRKYYRRVLDFFRYRIADERTADERAQETFVRVVNKKGVIEQSFRGYMWSVARNVLLEWEKQRVRDRRTSPDEHGGDWAPAPEPSLGTMLRGESYLTLKGLRELDVQSQILLSFGMLELSGKEMAEALGRPEPTVRRQLKEARQKLKDLIRATTEGTAALRASTVHGLDEYLAKVRAAAARESRFDRSAVLDRLRRREPGSEDQSTND